jgi:hypothetical protein
MRVVATATHPARRWMIFIPVLVGVVALLQHLAAHPPIKS